MPLKNRNLAVLAGSVLLLGVVTYGYWSFLYRPLHQAILQSEGTLSKLNADIQAAQARAAQLNQIQAEMANLQVEVAELEKQLPKTRELPALIRLFTHRLESYGLTLSNFAPQKPVSRGLYDEILYNISLTANFHSLGHFLTAMGKGDRLFAARDLSLTGLTSSKDPSTTVNATFKLVSFKYRE